MKVSVIVPFHKGIESMQATLHALVEQTMPTEEYEVLIVNNGAATAIQVAETYTNVHLIQENSRPNSYLARAAGIRAARGAVIAFTDSDCIPDSDWLERGVTLLKEQGVDMLAGQIRMEIQQGRWDEMVDALVFLQQKYLVEVRQGACFSNFFCRKEIFSKLALPTHMESGADLLFTHLALQAGHSMEYSSEVIVSHGARDALALLKKAYRVGKGAGARVASNTQIDLRTPPLLLRYANPAAFFTSVRTRYPHVSGCTMTKMYCLLLSMVTAGCIGFLVTQLYTLLPGNDSNSQGTRE